MPKFGAVLTCGFRTNFMNGSLTEEAYFVKSGSRERIKTWAKLKTRSGRLLISSREMKDGQEVGVLSAYIVSEGEVRPDMEFWRR